MNDLRKTVLVTDEGSREIDFRDLKAEDKFQLFEPDGTQVTVGSLTTFTSSNDAYPNEHGTYTVDVYTEDEKE